MPIRFRCAYCNQLLGIARRKAGQVVRCPTCAGQVVVPSPEPGDEAAEPEPEPAPGNQPFFEGSEFEDLFNPAPAASPPAKGPARAPARAPATDWKTEGAPPEVDVEPVALPEEPARPSRPPAPPAKPPPGIVLSPVKATVLTVVFIVLVAMAFGVGLLVGWYLGAARRDGAQAPSAAPAVAARAPAARLGQKPVEGRHVQGQAVDEGEVVRAQAQDQRTLAGVHDPGVAAEAQVQQRGAAGADRHVGWVRERAAATGGPGGELGHGGSALRGTVTGVLTPL